MTITYWNIGNPEDEYENSVKGITTIDFYNGRIVCYDKNKNEYEFQISDLLTIEED